MDRTITVKGIGKVSAKPDCIVIAISLEAQDMNYERTMADAGEQLESLRKSLTKAGFRRDDIKTSDFNVEPEFQSERDKNGSYKRWFAGYVCRHSLTVEFDLDMARLAQIFAALAECSAEPVFTVQFTIKDRDAINVGLLQSAARNAKAKAVILCQSAGVSLGELITIDYNWGELRLCSPTQFEMSERCLSESADANRINIEPENINASDTVTFVWSIR